MPPMNNFTKTCLAIAVSQATLNMDLRAATVTVNSNLDTNTSSVCTLRSAMSAINNQDTGIYFGCTANVASNPLGSNDEIVFDLPVGQETITLNGNALNIFVPMSLNPDGQTGISINANQQSQVISIGGGASNTRINQLTLTGGSSTTNGGAIYMSNATSVTISNSTITNNMADGVGGGVFVRDALGFTISGSTLTQNTGAIFLRYTNNAEISDCTISNNTSDNNGVGINLYSANDTTITDSLISENTTNSAGDTGGAMYIYQGTNNSLENSQVSLNYAGDGGGIYLQGTTSLSIIGSTINNNSAANKSGGLHVYNSNNMTIANSTISANSAPSDYGGGIYWDSNSAFGVILQSTIVDNIADEGGGIYALRSIDISNTVIANNSGADCNGNIVGTDLANWVSDGSCNGNAASGDPRLGILQDNDGPTPTHKPQSGSGLNKAGNITVCTDAPVAGIDQRGEVRGATECTIGAVEFIDESSLFVVPLQGDKAVIFEL